MGVVNASPRPGAAAGSAPASGLVRALRDASVMTWRLLVLSVLLNACESPPRGPCDPVGTWRVRDDQTQGDRTLPGMDRVRVEKKDGRFAFSFPDRAFPADQCVQDSPAPGKLTIEGDVSADGCTLTVARREMWCMSGEDQC